MRRAGIREARQDFTGLLEDVRNGREVVITEHGRPVARSYPSRGEGPFRILRPSGERRVRWSPSLSQAVLADRDEQL